jgi:hypothetical protein
MFAEASNGEEGATGSLAGDQTGIELRARQWYAGSAGWGKVYHFRDSAVREKVAHFAELAVLNGWIGYDQNGRSTSETELKKVGYSISAVHTPCEMDCSMLVYEAVKHATGVDCKPLTDEVYFGIGTGIYPHSWNFDVYMERVLPMAGVGVDVYTVTNWVDDTAAEKTLRSGVLLSDVPNGETEETTQSKYYESPYDTIRASFNDSVAVFDAKYGVTKTKTYTKTYDLATLQANLSVSVANSNSVWLDSAANLVRGDIIRKPTIAGAGHIAVWI